MLTAEGECRIGLSIGPICNSIARVSRNSSASGMSFQPKRGSPMSTVNKPPALFHVLSTRPSTSKQSLSLPVSLLTIEAMQRMPLPQAPASEPSRLKMRMNESVPAVRGG